MKLKYNYNFEEECVVKEYLKDKLSHHLLKRIRVLDNIKINGQNGKNYYVLKKGDVLELEFDEEMNQDIEVSDETIDIVYEDEYLLIVNKKSYISSQPSVKHQKDNLLSMVKKYFIDNKIDGNMHLINRLDYQTSGLVMIAKSGIVQYFFEDVKIDKRYLCVVKGIIDNDKGIINYPISRYPQPSIKRYVDLENGKNAITEYEVIKRDYLNDVTLLDINLITGRTHQIRVHFSYINHPLIGDKLYNEENKNNNELLLHAYKLSFVHPIIGDKIEIINYPNWFDNYI